MAANSAFIASYAVGRVTGFGSVIDTKTVSISGIALYMIVGFQSKKKHECTHLEVIKTHAELPHVEFERIVRRARSNFRGHTTTITVGEGATHWWSLADAFVRRDVLSEMHRNFEVDQEHPRARRRYMLHRQSFWQPLNQEVILECILR